MTEEPLMATDLRIEKAEQLIRTAEDLLKLARRDLHEKPSDERLPAALWRLVDAAVLVAQLVPGADVGLKHFTGRGGRLELARVRGCARRGPEAVVAERSEAVSTERREPQGEANGEAERVV